MNRLLCAALLVPLALQAEKPNIVIILADDLGYGDLGCYNPRSKIPTLHLDRLARDGIRLTDAHAPAALCTPTRYGLLTGRYPWRAPQVGNVGIWGKPVIPRGRLTLPKLLQQHGYMTACIGKWHLGWEWPTRDGNRPKTARDGTCNVDFTQPIREGPTTRGFDYYFGTCVPNFPPYCFIENDRTAGIPSEASTEFEFPGPKAPGWEQREILPVLTHMAVRYIEAAARCGKPFLLYFSLTSPHHPVVPTLEFRGRSRAGDYGDFVAQTDWSVGQVLAALEREKFADNTLVVFTSDNGPEITRIRADGFKLMEIGAYDRIQRYGHASMGELRGTKCEAWEGGHRVPFLARWPGKIPAGTVSDQLFCLTDLFATAAAILGVPLPDNVAEDSFNALPVLFGGNAERDHLVSMGVRDNLAVRQGDWVWINARAGFNAEPDWFRLQRGYEANPFPGQLYNLQEDLSQRHNRFADQPQKVNELQALLEKLRQQGRSRP
ncbi:MAG: arylsulfatase [Verrucomicrobiae bacterium]|nr:arylsulfatase [Verrucomicrobiae bacterium]